MPISTDAIERVMDTSLAAFFTREVAGLLDDVNERSSCGRLSFHMQIAAKEAGLSGYYADVEYNRKQNGRVKTILDDEMEVININVDLILHSRGYIVAEDNLIAVEMKKSGRPEHEKIADRNRLRAMTKSSYDGVWSSDGVTHPEHVCGYRLGVYIEINRQVRQAHLEYFSQGERFATRERSF